MAPGLGDYIATKELRRPSPAGFDREEKKAKSGRTSIDSLADSRTSQVQDEEAATLRTGYEAPLSGSSYGQAVEQLQLDQDVLQYAGKPPLPQYADSYPATTTGYPSSASPSINSASQADGRRLEDSSLDGIISVPTPSRLPLQADRNLGLRPPRLAFPRHSMKKSENFHTSQQAEESQNARLVLKPDTSYEYNEEKPQIDDCEDDGVHIKVKPQKKGTMPTHQLDYSIDELYELNYEELENESFDYDPRDKRVAIDGISDDMLIADRMTLVQKLPPEQQRQFITTLSADEWEEAGHWFESEFARLNACVVKCRQEKREIARRHEQIVFQRYAAVKEESDRLQRICDEMAVKGKEVVRLATPEPNSQQTSNINL